jgi:hypothetical protein
VNVPWRVGHYDVELPQNFEIEIPDIAVDPLGVEHSLANYGLFLGDFRLLILFNVMDELAIGIMTGIEMWAVAKAFVSFLIDNSSKMLLGAVRMSLSFLALIPGAMIAIL